VKKIVTEDELQHRERRYLLANCEEAQEGLVALFSPRWATKALLSPWWAMVVNCLREESERKAKPNVFISQTVN
jgi:hypothetical protein